MQNSLNYLDGDKRNKNVVVAGLIEDYIAGLDNEGITSDNKEKLHT